VLFGTLHYPLQCTNSQSVDLRSAGAWILVIARGDRSESGCAVLATALHMLGLWTHGEDTELVQWGLVTNGRAVLAGRLLRRARAGGDPRTGVVSHPRWPLAACVYEPRSGIAIAIAAGALSAMLPRAGDMPSITVIGRSIALVGGASALLATPVLVHCSGTRDLYFNRPLRGLCVFANKPGVSTVTSVSLPVVVAQAGGWYWRQGWRSRSLVRLPWH